MGLRGLSNAGFRHVFEEGEITVPRYYCLHVSLLQAKVGIITDTSIKRRLRSGNGEDAKRGLVEVGLNAEHTSPSKPGGQMLVMNF